MPIFRFHCPACNLETDEFRRVANRDDPLACPRGHGAMVRRIMPTMVQADIQPYRAVVMDKETGRYPEIHSRKQHREFLARNDYVEVGNEMCDTEKRRLDDGPADAPMLSVEQLKKQGFVEEAF